VANLLSFPNNLFIGLIGILAFAGIALNFAVASRFEWLLRQVRRRRQGESAPEIDKIEFEFRALLERRQGRADARLAVERFVLSQRIYGLFPVLTAERIVRFSGSTPILVGLSGNFVGWLLALGDMTSAWPTFTAEMKPAEMVGLLEALQKPLSGLETAFLASVAGIVASVLVNLVTYLRSGHGARESFMADLEEYLQHSVNVDEGPADMRQLMLSVLDRFDDISVSIKESVAVMATNVTSVIGRVDTTVATAGALVENMHPMTVSISQASEAIQQMAGRMGNIVGQLENASGTFAGGATTLESGLQSFATELQRLADTQDRSVTLLTTLQTSTTDTLSDLAQRMRGLEQAETLMAETSVKTGAALDAMVAPVRSAANQLSEQYLSLERQTQSLEATIGKMRASGDRLEVAAIRLQEAQTQFVRELEQNLVQANQAQLQELTGTLNDLKSALDSQQRTYLLSLNNTVSAFLTGMSSPTLERLTQTLEKMANSSQTGRSA
jgi:hypothetical protein